MDGQRPHGLLPRRRNRPGNSAARLRPARLAAAACRLPLAAIAWPDVLTVRSRQTLREAKAARQRGDGLATRIQHSAVADVRALAAQHADQLFEQAAGRRQSRRSPAAAAAVFSPRRPDPADAANARAERRSAPLRTVTAAEEQEIAWLQQQQRVDAAAHRGPRAASPRKSPRSSPRRSSPARSSPARSSPRTAGLVFSGDYTFHPAMTPATSAELSQDPLRTDGGKDFVLKRARRYIQDLAQLPEGTALTAEVLTEIVEAELGAGTGTRSQLRRLAKAVATEEKLLVAFNLLQHHSFMARNFGEGEGDAEMNAAATTPRRHDCAAGDETTQGPWSPTRWPEDHDVSGSILRPTGVGRDESGSPPSAAAAFGTSIPTGRLVEGRPLSPTQHRARSNSRPKSAGRRRGDRQAEIMAWTEKQHEWELERKEKLEEARLEAELADEEACYRVSGKLVVDKRAVKSFTERAAAWEEERKQKATDARKRLGAEVDKTASRTTATSAATATGASTAAADRLHEWQAKRDAKLRAAALEQKARCRPPQVTRRAKSSQRASTAGGNQRVKGGDPSTMVAWAARRDAKIAALREAQYGKPMSKPMSKPMGKPTGKAGSKKKTSTNPKTRGKSPAGPRAGSPAAKKVQNGAAAGGVPQPRAAGAAGGTSAAAADSMKLPPPPPPAAVAAAIASAAVATAAPASPPPLPLSPVSPESILLRSPSPEKDAAGTTSAEHGGPAAAAQNQAVPASSPVLPPVWQAGAEESHLHRDQEAVRAAASSDQKEVATVQDVGLVLEAESWLAKASELLSARR